MRDTHTLLVMRHAKAGELPGGPDFERALRPRGQRDSAAAGRWLAANGLRPDLVICSAARRTRQTWQQMAPELGGQVPVSVDRQLYQADAEQILEVIRRTPPDASTLLYIGHNPAAAQLVGLLTGTEPVFPTAAVAVVGLAGDWPAVAAGAGQLVASWTPGAAD